jgi:hypothetical protein
VKPGKPLFHGRVWQLVDPQLVELVILHQCDQIGCPPIFYCCHVGIQVPVPDSRPGLPVLFAGTERDTEDCLAFRQADFIDNERMSLARTDQHFDASVIGEMIPSFHGTSPG